MIFDLIAGMNAGGGAAAWTPDDLFDVAAGDRGFWFDASNLTRLFQDAAGTVPVTASGQPVGLWKTKLVSYDISQNTAAARPVYVVTSGKAAIRFDGVDDQLLLPAGVVTSCVNGVTIAMGQKKSPNQNSSALLVENTIAQIRFQNQVTGNSSAVLGASISGNAGYSTTTANTVVSWAAPSPLNVATTTRVNGVTEVGTDVPIRNSATVLTKVPGAVGNACDFSQVFFINRVLTAGEITLLETFIGSKQ